MNSRFSRIKRGNRLKEEKEGHAQTHERGGGSIIDMGARARATRMAVRAKRIVELLR